LFVCYAQHKHKNENFLPMNERIGGQTAELHAAIIVDDDDYMWEWNLTSLRNQWNNCSDVLPALRVTNFME
jgi:hypothetical protein